MTTSSSDKEYLPPENKTAPETADTGKQNKPTSMPDVPVGGPYPRAKLPSARKPSAETATLKMVTPTNLPAKDAGVIRELTYQEFLQTAEAATHFRKNLSRTVDQIDSGFRSTMVMYQVAFYLGVVLILASFGVFIVFRESILSAALGGLGIADFIAYFVTKPPQHLQRSRADLAQLQAAFYNWYTEVSNWNLYLSNLTFDGPEDMDVLRAVTREMRQSTAETVRLIEKYCETSANTRPSESDSNVTPPS